MTLLGGCSCCCGNWAPIGPSPDITPADIAGTWVSEEGARLILKTDGTFAAESLEKCDDFEGDHPSSFSGGTGTWTLGEPEFMDPYQRLTLELPAGDMDNWKAQDDEIVYLFGDTDSGGICYFNRA